MLDERILYHSPLQEIEKSFQDNEYKVNKAVEEGKKLLVQDFKSRDNQMLQLHQKLRTNTSEIKVRYDTVSKFNFC